MKCEDARALTAAGSRKIGLTELALVETHLRQCAECRDFSRSRQAPPPPQRTVSRAVVVGSRLRALRSTPRAFTARAGLVAGEATRRGGLLCARARIALTRTARAGARTLGVIPVLRARAGARLARLRAPLSRPLTRVAGAVWIGLLAMLTLYAGHYALHPRPESPIDAGRATTIAAGPGGSPTPLSTPLDIGSPPPAMVERGAVAEPEGRTPPGSKRGVPWTAVSSERPDREIRGTAESPTATRPSVQKPEPARAQPPAPKRAEATGPEPSHRRMPPLAHVAGQLSVKNRGTAERDLTALLARTGGTLVGTDQDGAVMFVDAVVPQSGYEEFTRGLSRLGSWRIEAERSPLPEDVHLTIRVRG